MTQLITNFQLRTQLITFFNENSFNFLIILQVVLLNPLCKKKKKTPLMFMVNYENSRVLKEEMQI